MRSVILAALLLAGCASAAPIRVPCLPPVDHVPLDVVPLPERDMKLDEAIKLWVKDRAALRRAVNRYNDLLGYVRTQCR